MKKLVYKYRDERGTASSLGTTLGNLLRKDISKRELTEFKVSWVSGRQRHVRMTEFGSLVDVCPATLVIGFYLYGSMDRTFIICTTPCIKGGSRSFDPSAVRKQGLISENRCAGIVFEVHPSMEKRGLYKMSSRQNVECIKNLNKHQMAAEGNQVEAQEMGG